MKISNFLSGLIKKKNSSEIIEKIVQLEDKPVIGIVVTTFDKGGLEQVVLNLYLGYKQKGYKVYMLCQKNILGVMADAVADKEMLIFNDETQQFLDYLKNYNITILHYHYNTFACDMVKKMGVRTIYTMHNVYTWKSDKEIAEYRVYMETMDRVVPVSNLVKDYFLQRSGMSEDKVQVIYNGIDFKELDNHELPDYLERKALKISEEDITLGFIASFYPVKYQIGMIGVMEKLIKSNPNVKLLYVGNTENEYYQNFLKEYETSPARDNMILVPYFQHKYMGEFLRRIIDIFTLPTLQEGCSNAVLEAIYCDKPLLLTRVGNAMDVAGLKSCVVVAPAYKDILTTSNEDMLAISTYKNSANQEELIGGFLKLIHNLEIFKQNAKIPSTEKHIYETSFMVEQYLDLITELTN